MVALFGKFVCDVITFNFIVRLDLENMCGVGVWGDLSGPLAPAFEAMYNIYICLYIPFFFDFYIS